MTERGGNNSFYRAAMLILVALHLMFDIYKYHADTNKLHDDIMRIDSIAINPTTTDGVADRMDGTRSRSLATNFSIIDNNKLSPSHSPSVVSVKGSESQIIVETIEAEEEVGEVDMDSDMDSGEDIPMDSTYAPTSAWWDSGIRTNFDYKVPFNFSYIFLIGGVCNGKDPDNWYSKFVAAGSATINVTDIICYEYNRTDPDDSPYNVYQRPFHLDGLNEVVRRVSSKLNETLVITTAVGLESDWTPVADLLRKGMAFWHVKEDPNNFILEDYGLVPEEVLYFYFRWGEERAAWLAGKELCRLKKGATSLKYGQVWARVAGSGRSAVNYRTELAISAFKENCPDTKLENVWNLYSDQDAAYKTTLLFNPHPDLILAATDWLADKILQVAEEVFPSSIYNKMAATGWDNDANYRHLLDKGKILTTVNQGVHFPKKGLWSVISTVLDVVQDFGLNSTAAVQKELNINGTTILTDALLIASDNEGYLISKLLEGYDAKSTGVTKNVQVSTGVWNTTIAQMDPFEGKFEAIFVRIESWVDPRLEWDTFLESFEGTLTIDRESIWTPVGMYFPNGIGFADATILHASPAVVSSNGTVRMETSIHAMFLCETIDELRRYPFESYDCAMTLKGPKGTTLDTSYGFDVTQIDPHFKTTVSVGKETGGPIVNFKLTFERRPFGVYVSVILPGIVINMIGFMAFWIPGLEHKVALAIAALLCTLTYRTALEIPDIAAATWVEVFMMINTGYLFAVMIITWFSFGSSSIMGRCINKHFKPIIHPRTVARKAKARFSASGLTASGITASVVGNLSNTPEVSFKDNGAEGGVAAHSSSDNSIDLNFPEHPSCPTSLDPDSDEKSCNQESISNGPHGIKRPAMTKKEREKVATKLKRFVSERILETTTRQHANLDWIGRWFVVPSYFVMVLSLLIGGWGYT